jgi:hypothetical protein
VGLAGHLDPDAHAQFNPPGDIVLRLSNDAAAVAGRLRHELEHVKQHRAYGAQGKALYDLVRCVLPEDSRLFFNLVPAEVDANAAAAAHIRERYPAEVQRLSCSDDCQLTWSLSGPQSLTTLPVRMIAFAFTFCERCNALANERGSSSFAELLDSAFAGAGDVWQSLLKASGHGRR